jgi:O-antigen ligase
MVDTARQTTLSSARGPAVVIGLLAVAVVAGVAAALGPRYLYVTLAVLLGLAAVVKPAWGLMGYLVLAATLPASEGVTPHEVAVFGLLGWLFLLGSIRILHAPPKDKVARSLTKAVYVLFAVIAISLVPAWQHEIALKDWARDVVPLSNLALVILVPAFFRHEKDAQVLRIVFLAAVIFIGVHGAWVLGRQILPDRPYFASPFRVGSTWLIILLVAGGAAAISEFRKISWKHLSMGIIGIVAAILTGTRTVWIGVLAVILVSMLLNLKRGHQYIWRNALLLGFVLLTAGGLIYVWQVSGSPGAWAAQQARFATLQNLEEDQSVEIRQRQVAEALSHFAADPLLGVGLGYQYFYKIEYTEKYDAGTNYNHSDLANYLCKMGLLGATALYWLLIAAIVLSGRLKRQAPRVVDRWFGAMAQISLIGALVTGNSCPIIQERGATFFIGLLIGLVIAVSASTTLAIPKARGATMSGSVSVGQ